MRKLLLKFAFVMIGAYIGFVIGSFLISPLFEKADGADIIVYMIALETIFPLIGIYLGIRFSRKFVK